MEKWVQIIIFVINATMKSIRVNQNTKNAPTMVNPSMGGVRGVESILGGTEMEKELTKVADLMESGENEETEFTCIAVRILGLAANKYTGRLRAKAIKIATAICDFDEELGRKNGH